MSISRSKLLVDGLIGVVVGALALGTAQFATVARDVTPDHRRGFGGRGWEGGPAFDLQPPSALLIGCVMVLVAGIAIRRWRPRTGYLLTVAGTIGYLVSGHPFGPVMLAPALGLLAVATRYPVRHWVAWSALLVPVSWSGFVREPVAGLTDPDLYQAVLFGTGLMVLPALIGLIRRNRDDAQRRTRELDLRRSAFEERLRIAREVHDVVGHSLSVINMQAGVALHVLDRRPEQVATSLQAIRSTSKNALDELRSTLEVFREADYRGTGFAPDGEREPAAGLSRLPALVDAFRAGGREVELIMDDDPAGVPAAVDLAGYRIVQEALTNVARHTTDAAARVRIGSFDGQLEVEVTDNGPGPGRGPSEGGAGSGSGIAGMVERARGVGGTLSAGPGAHGGFRVFARLPIGRDRS